MRSFQAEFQGPLQFLAHAQYTLVEGLHGRVNEFQTISLRLDLPSFRSVPFPAVLMLTSYGVMVPLATWRKNLKVRGIDFPFLLKSICPHNLMIFRNWPPSLFFFFFAMMGLFSHMRALSNLQLSGLEACGILVPWPGIEPASPELEGRFFTAWDTKEATL